MTGVDKQMAVRAPPITPIWNTTDYRQNPRPTSRAIAIGVPNMNQTKQFPKRFLPPAAGAGLMSVVPKALCPQPVSKQSSVNHSLNPHSRPGAESCVNQFNNQYAPIYGSKYTSPPLQGAPVVKAQIAAAPAATVYTPVVVIEEPELDFAPVDAALLLCADAVQQARSGAPTGELECVDDAVTVCLDVIAKEVQKLSNDRGSSRLSLWQQSDCAREPMTEATAVALSRKAMASAAEAVCGQAVCGQISMIAEQVAEVDQTTQNIVKGRTRRKLAAQEKSEFVPPAPKPRGQMVEIEPPAAAECYFSSQDDIKAVNSSKRQQGQVLFERQQVNIELPRTKAVKTADKTGRVAKIAAKSRNMQPKSKDTGFVPPVPKPRK